MADILTPALGESVTEATIAKWTKKVGDPVKKDELLVELETDKVSLEVVSPADGVLGDIKAAEGDNVVPGTVLGSVTEGASAAAAPPAAPAAAPAKAAKAAPAAAAPAAASIDITVPVMGESVAEGSMGKWVKKNGDTVKKDELLVEIETDKVAVEVSAPADGVLTIAADEGATVTPGQKIGSISGSGAASAPAAAAPAPAAAPANTGSAQVSASKNETLSPAVQRVVGENNLDPPRDRRATSPRPTPSPPSARPRLRPLPPPQRPPRRAPTSRAKSG
jgi:2-oxoglutarate dehydrogenase E2 component (dihydrolipoamide succinyltransferase)